MCSILHCVESEGKKSYIVAADRAEVHNTQTGVEDPDSYLLDSYLLDSYLLDSY